MVARKLATKFGEKAEAGSSAVVPVTVLVVVMVVVVEVAVSAEHKGNRFPVNRDPRFD